MSKSNFDIHTSLLLRGFLDTLPLIVACIPFAIVFGALAIDAGLSLWQTLGISAFVFAGASQFVAVTLLAVSTPFIVIVITVFVMNIRHLLYSLNVVTQVKVPPLLRVPMAFWMTDESFATVSRYLKTNPTSEDFRAYYWGSALGMYINWVACTAVGALLGATIPDMTSWSLDMAMVLVFIAIVVPALQHRAHCACVLVAGFAAVITYDWPYNIGLLFSALLAIFVGVTIDMLWLKKNNKVSVSKAGDN